MVRFDTVDRVIELYLDRTDIIFNEKHVQGTAERESQTKKYAKEKFSSRVLHGVPHR